MAGARDCRERPDRYANQYAHFSSMRWVLDQYGQGEAYRNHFVTAEGSKDYADCVAQVELGHMMRRER